MLENMLDLDKIAKINLGMIPVLNVLSFGYLLSLDYSRLIAFLMIFSLAILALSINYWAMFQKTFEVIKNQEKINHSNAGNFISSIIKHTPIILILSLQGIFYVLSILFLVLNPISTQSYVLLSLYLYLFLYFIMRFSLYTSFARYIQ